MPEYEWISDEIFTVAGDCDRAREVLVCVVDLWLKCPA